MTTCSCFLAMERICAWLAEVQDAVDGSLVHIVEIAQTFLMFPHRSHASKGPPLRILRSQANTTATSACRMHGPIRVGLGARVGRGQARRWS